MKNRSPMRIFSALVAGWLLTGAAAPEPARAEARTNLTVDYQIALGGFDFGRADIRAEIGGDAYTLDALIKTEGIAEQFFETSFALESRGAFSGTRVKPARFVSTYTDPDRSRRVELTYPGTGIPTMRAEPAYADGFGPNIHQNDLLMTQDPISALLLPATGTSPCNRSLPLFDGRRRYDLRLKPDGEAEMNGPDDAYKGTVLRCSVDMIPVAGYERKTLIKLLEREDSIRVWLAPVDDGRVWVPVRLTLRTPFGGAVMRATRFEATLASAP